MREAPVVWVGMGLGMVLGVALIGLFHPSMPETVEPLGPASSVSAGAGSLEQRSLSSLLPRAPAAGPIAPPEMRTAPGGARYWNDPSIDPKLLERAFAPPSKPLPPEDRPTASAIIPSAEEWRQLERDGAAVVH
jgi:hypothetical protein